MDFAARRYALEAQRRGLAGDLPDAGRRLAGAIPLSWQPRPSDRQSKDMLQHFEMDELRQIDVALARLREGSYGFCQICGNDIEEERLDRNPATPFCESCES